MSISLRKLIIFRNVLKIWFEFVKFNLIYKIKIKREYISFDFFKQNHICCLIQYQWVKQKFKGTFSDLIRDYRNRKNGFGKSLHLHLDATWAEESNGCFSRITFTKNLRNAVLKHKMYVFMCSQNHLISKSGI